MGLSCVTRARVLQSKSSQARGSDSGSSELDLLREEEEVSEADNREKEILIDRIQSIKEEKYVALYLCRLCSLRLEVTRALKQRASCPKSSS